MIPTRYTVTRERFTPGAKDRHGKPADAWGPPVPVAVHGWAPPSPDTEPALEARRAVERTLDLYAPAGTAGAPRDRWTVAGVHYLQVGHPEDFTRGPWPFAAAGVRINLKTVEG